MPSWSFSFSSCASWLRSELFVEPLLAEAPVAPRPTVTAPTRASARADLVIVPKIPEFVVVVMMFPSFRAAPVAPTGDKSEEPGRSDRNLSES